MDAQTLEAARCRAEFCKLFSSVSRILIVWALAEKELSASEIASAIGASPQNTSQHLQLLKSGGIVLARREGTAIYYRLVPHQLASDCPVLSRAHPFTQHRDTKVSTE